MASVFLSYGHEDVKAARAVALALEKAGHSVWWDRHIKGGTEYSKEIELALEAADVVVVLWSRNSVGSPWVRDEAASGRDRGRLIPLGVDSTPPPLGFRQFQTIELPSGRATRGAVKELLAGVALVKGTSAPAPSVLRAPPGLLSRSRVGLAAAAILVALLVASLVIWKPWAGRGDVVLAVGASSTDPASVALARDLATRLGGLRSTSLYPVRLVDLSDGSAKPDLRFEATSGGPANASLVLKSPRDSSILWSMEFEQPTGQRADLLQQLAYTAARIVNCAMEGLGGPVKLKPAPLKAYLSACAQLSDQGSFDLRNPLPLLLEVTEASPRFEPAWQALLLQEADLVSPEASAADTDPRMVAELRRHIAEARKINAEMAAAAIAEASLLPPRDFAGRMKHIEKAAERRPNDPIILFRLAGAMSETGRLNKAVDVAGQAVKLDPLSPSLHSNYTALIAYGGNFEGAKREMAKAEKLWPGTASLEDAQYRFHLRYGDPRIARALFNKHSDRGGTAPRMLLDARQNPSPATIEPFLTHVRERLRSMENPSAGFGFATVAFAAFDQTEDFFKMLLSWPRPDDIAIISEVFFRPEFAEERRDPRFLRVAQRAGLLDYWRTSGNWPDFCFETDFPYDCKAEAGKLAA